MTNFYKIRKIAKRKGPLGDSSSPIPISPLNEYTVTRLVTIPVLDESGDRKYGYYMKHPANIHIKAWNGADASKRADDIQVNTMIKAWGNGSKPWDGESKINWIEVPAPFDAEPLELQ